MKPGLALILALALVTAAVADEPITVPGRAGQETTAAAAPATGPLRLADREPLEPARVLAPARIAAADRLAALARRNAAGNVPTQNGFERALDAPVRVRLGAAELQRAAGGRAEFAGGLLAPAPGGDLSFTLAVEVEGADALRLHLTDVELPDGTRLWTYGDGDATGPPLAVEPGGSSELWLPAVTGARAWLELQLPAAALERGEPAAFELAGVLELFELDAAGRPAALAAAPLADESCLLDVSCVTQTAAIANASRAVGLMMFTSGGDGFVCSGGLLNDVGGTGTPFFLTANHCLSTQAEVSTIDITWDYRSQTCNGPVPSRTSLPRSFGGTLVQSNPIADFTLIRLNSAPGNRYFLGWTTSDPVGRDLQRISHPHGGPQKYSETTVTTPQGTCQEWPVASFLYELRKVGGIVGGSSGAPAWYGDDIVVGQLSGHCGEPPLEPCANDDYTVDGRFRAAYPFIAGALGGDPLAPPAPTDLFAAKVGKRKAVLKWTDQASTEDRYEILQLAGGDWQLLKQKKRNTTKVKIKHLERLTTYEFGVRACDGSACSPIESITVTTR
ncbi:MAG: fibronectin type III domain-containing protein [Acidobacteria bacterium]|nr:fibronectin type III domain-containing protein [Acidobacteriota bacterium]